MVKLPPNESESNAPFPTREMLFQHQRNRNLYMNRGPSTLIELEEFAELASSYMSTMATYPGIRQVAMNRLRQLFNMVTSCCARLRPQSYLDETYPLALKDNEFKLRCNVCGTAHNQDEITAPER